MFDRKEYNRKYQRNYYRKRMDILIEMLGGKCVECNTTDKLEFDHINPNDKEYEICDIIKYSWDKVLAEVAKCQLLCTKCHTKKSVSEGAFGHGCKISDYSRKGEEHPQAILKEYQVRAIKVMIENGIPTTKIALEFGVARPTIASIRLGRSWKHVEI